MHTAISSQLLPQGMRPSAHRAIWGRDRLRTGDRLAWMKGPAVAVAQFVATMRMAGMTADEQLVEIASFQQECDRGSQQSSTPSDRAEQPATESSVYFTRPDPPSRNGRSLPGSSPVPMTPGRSSELGDILERCVTPLMESMRASQEATVRAIEGRRESGNSAEHGQ